MKIALASDLHLEFSDLVLENTEKADVLVLAGDILIAQELHDFPENDNFSMEFTRRAKAERYRKFLMNCSKEFENIVYIAGNHEFYHGKWPISYSYLREETANFNNIYFMEKESIVIKSVPFICCTLWTSMNDADSNTILICKENMSDYHSIRNNKDNYRKLTPNDTIKDHYNALDFLRSEIDQYRNTKSVVVTHHAPSKKSTKPGYEENKEIGGAYSTDLEKLIGDNEHISFWLHGHTHSRHQYTVGKTTVVCNPRGYHGYEKIADEFQLLYLEIA